MMESTINDTIVEIKLVEYQDISKLRQHDDTIAWSISSVLIPLSITLFGLSMAYPSYKYYCGLLSLSVLWFWYFSYSKLAKHSNNRLKMLDTIEDFLNSNYPGLDMKHYQGHTAIKRKYAYSISTLRLIFACVLTFTWILYWFNVITVDL